MRKSGILNSIARVANEYLFIPVHQILPFGLWIFDPGSNIMSKPKQRTPGAGLRQT